MNGSALRLASFSAIQFRLNGFPDELCTPVRADERVYALSDSIRQPHHRRLQSKRRPSHPPSRSLYRNLAQDGFRYRLLTPISDIAYITGIGYEGNAMTEDVIEIPLTKGYVAIVDREDEALAEFSWRAKVADNGRVYAIRTDRAQSGSRYTVYMHREIVGDACNGLPVDHIDGDGLNNRRNNLRAVSLQDNNRNVSGPRKDSNSGVLGVNFHSRDRKWRVQIRVNGRKLHLGSFRTKEEAAEARLAAEAKFWGIQPRRVGAHANGEHQ